jgi:hypothetical protein
MESDYIKQTIADYFSLTFRELESNQRILGPKHITIYFLRIYTNLKWQQIAELVYYSCPESANRVSKLVINEIKNNPNFARVITDIEKKLKSAATQHILS